MRYRDNLPLVTANLVRMVYLVGFAVALQLYMRNVLGASPFTVSLLESVFWAGLLIFAPLWGALSDASGRRTVFLASSILLAGATIPLFGLLSAPAEVLLLRFLFAVLASAFPPVALAAMSVDATAADRGKDVAPYHTSRAVGFLIGWGASGLAVDALGFQGAFLVFGLTGVVGFVAAVRIRGIDTPEAVTPAAVWRKARQRWVPSRGDASLRTEGLHYLYAGIFLRKMGLVGIFSLIAIYADNVLGFAASLIGLLLALNPAAQLAFIDFFGDLADRRGRRAVYLFGFVASIPVPFLLLVAEGPAVFGAAYLLIGVSFAALIEGSTAFIGDVAPAHRQGELMGFRKSAQGLAGVIGPIIAGAVATVYGYRAMFMVLGLLIIAGAVVVWIGVGESLGDGSGNALRHDLQAAALDVAGRFTDR